MPESRGFRVRALGEIAIRCADLEAMTAFYRDIVGLQVLEEFADDGIVFFRLGESFGGHTSVLALFHHTAGRSELHARGQVAPETGARSSLHHIALAVDYGEQDAIMRWYERQGVPYRVQVFGWVGWRGIFAQDPEGNTVELVAYDASLLEGSAA
ncbi:MAG: VOC family protein [Hyphomicrobiaceae bacterium]